MLIAIGILSAVIFTISQTFRSEPVEGKKPAYGPMEVFEATIVAMVMCVGIAILILVILRAWLSNF